MSESSPSPASSRTRRPWILAAALLGLGLLACVCVTALAVLFRDALPGRNVAQRIPSPDGAKVLVTNVNTNQADPRTYLTVEFEIRDAATDVIVFRQNTGASDRMRWSMQWLSDDEVQLSSSDIGDYCWRQAAEGEWISAPCSR